MEKDWCKGIQKKEKKKRIKTTGSHLGPNVQKKKKKKIS